MLIETLSPDRQSPFKSHYTSGGLPSVNYKCRPRMYGDSPISNVQSSRSSKDNNPFLVPKNFNGNNTSNNGCISQNSSGSDLFNSSCSSSVVEISSDNNNHSSSYNNNISNGGEDMYDSSCDDENNNNNNNNNSDIKVGSLESPYREKRKQQSSEDVDELIRALGALNLDRDYWLQIAETVKSNRPSERFEGTKRFRVMLSVSGEIPIQDVIDTGVVPMFVHFLSLDDAALQFEAAWALTNIASGTGSQTEVVVGAGAIPKFIDLLSNTREDIREQGMWGLGNIAGDRSEYRDLILSYPFAVDKFLSACKKSRRVSTIRTGIWSLSNLCRGKPRPQYSSISAVIPYLAGILCYSTDQDTLSDACWALDGLSEHSTGVAAIISQGVVAQLVRLLSHREFVVQRPALRVIGQVAAGDTEQTQEVLDNGALTPLITLLKSTRKSVRKDVCWAFSNIAAGSPEQLQTLLSTGCIPKLLYVFHNDDELEIKKEAAWAICNACTTQRRDLMEYLVTNNCVKPVCDMLTIDDPKILEVALEALDNILAFGSSPASSRKLNSLLYPKSGVDGFGMGGGGDLTFDNSIDGGEIGLVQYSSNNNYGEGSNVCVDLVKLFDGVNHLYQLHTVVQGYGNYTVWHKAGEILQKWFSINNVLVM